jgi:predicted nucleotidyltransferase
METSNPIQWPNQNPQCEDEPDDHEIIRTSRQVDERFLAALARRIVAVSGATRVILFGSRARNEEREDSDVDLFVIVPGSAGGA